MLLKTNILFLFLGLSMHLQAKDAEWIEGYLIPSGGDTIRCEIAINRKTNGNKITIRTAGDSTEQVYRFKEGTVLGYGTRFLGQWTHYRYFSLKPEAESGVFKLYENGKYYRLYYTLESTSTNGVTSTTPKYVLVNANGQYDFFRTCVICGWRKRIAELIIDNQEAVEALQEVKAKEVVAFIVGLNKEK